MKLLSLITLAILASLATADQWDNIDWNKVVPVEDLPGFWDNKSPFVKSKYASKGGRVVGGNIAAPHQFPYQAAILLNFAEGVALCGGSVISSTVILTAAHCTYESTGALIILGAYDRTTADEGTQRRISVGSDAYREHADYDDYMIEQDISTIIVPYFGMTAEIQPIVLATGSDLFVGQTAVVSGFGVYVDNGSSSAVVRFVDLVVISTAQCELTFGALLDSHLCTSGANGRSSCSGDSGGPLTVQQNGHSVQIGIVSFGAYDGCELGYPAAFTRVTYFASWIHDHSH